MRKNRVDNTVKNLLENYPHLRSDDFMLIGMVCKILSNIDCTTTFNSVINNHKTYNLPSFESITRARRKLQRRYPHLSNKKMKEIRKEEEIKYINYALEK